MKNFYSLLAAGLLTSMGASAVTGELPVGEMVYIQNVRSGLFLCGGNSWGTQGSVAAQGNLFQIEAGYKFVNQEISVTNKRLGDNLYVDNAGAAWNVVEVNPGEYTIETAGKYLIQSTNEGSHGMGYELGTDGSGDLWRFLTRSEAIEQLKAATPENPMPASFLIADANFSRNHSNAAWKKVGGNLTVNGINGGQTAASNLLAESWKSTFECSQKLEDVPNGKYRITAQASVVDYAGVNDNLAYVFANEGKTPFVVSSNSATGTMENGENNMAMMAESFKAGLYYVEPLEVIVTDNTLNVGFKSDYNNSWCIFDNINIEYLGAVEDLGILDEAYKTNVSNAQALVGQPMNATVAKELGDAIKLKPSNTADSYNEVNSKISAAASAAKASIKNYQDLQTALAAADGLNAKGKEIFNNDATIKALVGAYNDGSFVALTAEDQNAINDAVVAATMASLEKGADLTGLINNAACAGKRGQKDYGWSVDDKTVGNRPFGSADLFENWNGTPANAYFDYYQIIPGLPAGKYIVSAEMQYNDAASDDENGVYASVGSTEVKGGTKAGVNGFQKCTTTEITVNEGEDLRIGVKTFGTQSVGWTVIQNFTLTYAGEASLDDMVAALSTAVSNAEALAAKPMNAAKATALANAVKKYKSAKYTNAADYTAAIGEVNAAISDAEPSVKFYANVETVLYAKVEAAMALDAAGQASFMTSAAPYVSAGQAGELDETLDYAAMIDAAYIAAVKAQTTPGADMTGAIVNPQINGADGWTTERPLGGNGPLLGGTSFEFWAGNASSRDEASFNYYQVIKGLKAGQYQLTVDAYNSLNGEPGAVEFEPTCLVYANNDSTLVDVDSDSFGTDYSVLVTIAEGEDLQIGVKSMYKTRMAARWFAADNFRLTYVGVPAPTYAINISAGENGTVTAKSGNYKEGETVTMTATSAADYKFAGWFLGDTQLSAEETYTYTVGAADANIVAKFDKIVKYNIEIAATDGGTVRGNGGAYEAGSTISLRATADAGYNFVGWYVGDEMVSAEARYTYTVGEADAKVVAKFEKIVVNFTLALSATEGGSVFGDGQFAEGTKVTIDAVPADGYSFVGWFNGETLVSTSENTVIELTANTALQAKFEKIIVNFDLALSATEGGSVFGDGKFAEGTTVTVDAVADEGYDFVGWFSGDLLISDVANYAFELTANTTLQAKFEKKAPAITTHDVAITISSLGYGTFSSAENVDFATSGVAAYVANACNGSTVSLKKVNEVPAGQGVLIFAQNGGNFTATATTAEFDEVGNNFFVAGAGQTIGATNSEGWLNCILTVDAATKSKVGLYPLGETQTATIPAGKAFLCAPLDPAKVSSLSALNLIFDEDVTGADEITLDLESGKVFVNAAGVKSTKAVKGINITEDGKKIIK